MKQIGIRSFSLTLTILSDSHFPPHIWKPTNYVGFQVNLALEKEIHLNSNLATLVLNSRTALKFLVLIQFICVCLQNSCLKRNSKCNPQFFHSSCIESIQTKRTDLVHRKPLECKTVNKYHISSMDNAVGYQRKVLSQYV